MTEQERFEAWFFKHKREQHSILWGANEPNAALGCKLRLEASHNDMWLAWQAAIPDGYMLVPAEPTEAMIDAFFKGKVMPQALDYYARSKARCIEDYKAMIAAAQEQT